VFYCLADPTLLSLIEDVGRWQAARAGPSVSPLPIPAERPGRRPPRAGERAS